MDTSPWIGRTTLAAALAAGALGLALGLAAARHPRFTWDGIVYALVADEVRAGRGLRSPVVPLHAGCEWPDARGTVPFTVQPPGYPLLLAGLGAGRDGLGRALAWNALAHAATAALGALLAAGLVAGAPPATRTSAAVGAGVATASALPLLAWLPWSMAEATFGALGTATLVATVAARDSTWRRALAGALAALAVSVRYHGLALVVPLAWEAWRAGGGARGRLRAAAPLLVPPLLVFGLLVARGQPFLQDTPRGPLEALARTAGIAWAVLAATAGGSWPVRVIGFVLVLAALVRVVDRRRGSPAEGGACLVPALAALGFAALLAAGLLRRLDPEPRYGLPLLPPLLALAAAPAARLATGPSAGRRLLGGLALVLLAGAPLVCTLRLLDPQPAPAPLEGSATVAWLGTALPPGEPVVTNAAPLVAWAARRPAAELPQRALNTAFALPEDVAGWLPGALRACGARHLVLLRAYDPTPFGAHVAALQRGEAVNPALTLAYEGRDGVVWRLRPQ